MLAHESAFSLLTGLEHKGYLDNTCFQEIERDIQLYIRESTGENHEKGTAGGDGNIATIDPEV